MDQVALLRDAQKEGGILVEGANALMVFMYFTFGYIKLIPSSSTSTLEHIHTSLHPTLAREVSSQVSVSHLDPSKRSSEWSKHTQQG